MDDVDEDSTTANVTNSEVTLRKDSYQTNENGENLVYYYVTVNPGIGICIRKAAV